MREKLIELLEQSYFNSIETLADDLIANGVTIQRWIPVTERLPDSGKCVLICTEYGTAEGSYSAYNKSWIQFRWNAKDLKVTHWMPLPEPPKGE